jgi:hypothetical protein
MKCEQKRKFDSEVSAWNYLKVNQLKNMGVYECDNCGFVHTYTKYHEKGHPR